MFLWGGGAVFEILALGFAFWSNSPAASPAPAPGPAVAPPPPVPARPGVSAHPADLRAAAWPRIEADVKNACDREEFGRAVETLEQALSGSTDPDWTWLVRRRQLEVQATAQRLLADLSSQARSAKARGADREAGVLAARVAAWKLPDCQIVIPAPPAPARQEPPVPAPPAQPAPSPGAATVVIFHDRLAPGWVDWSWSSQRSFDSKDCVLNGDRSIRVVYEGNGAALYLHSDLPLDVDRLDALEFSCRVEGGAMEFFVKLSDEKK